MPTICVKNGDYVQFINLAAITTVFFLPPNGDQPARAKVVFGGNEVFVWDSANIATLKALVSERCVFVESKETPKEKKKTKA